MKVVLNLLFIMATWHAYAKLRLHTDTTLSYFDESTVALGKGLRQFRKVTCEAFNTTELAKEASARVRREAVDIGKGAQADSTASERAAKKQRKLNLNTYKVHALGHYPAAIRRFGTTDGYTTQVVCLFHVFFHYHAHRSSRTGRIKS